ncbi:MAG: hypothetical protein NPMRD1_50013 [Nitrosopumilales archaeon]|nr:MAG: hypothetical protein NPMRD1_50013 [Nitrosopumilales archaeon]
MTGHRSKNQPDYIYLIGLDGNTLISPFNVEIIWLPIEVVCKL